jgi:transaldolase
VLSRFAQAGVEYDALAAKLQSEGAESFDASWNDLMGCIASKSELLTKAG